MTQRHVWMAGPALDAPGGMSAVVCSYRDAGLFEAAAVRYLNTYTAPGVRTQLRVFGAALLRFGRALAVGDVRLLHVHSASRGSFWRKSLLCAMARFAGVPYLFHIHSGEFLAFHERGCGVLGRWWIKRTLCGAGAVLVLTPGWLARMRAAFGEARFLVAPNPVVVAARAPAARGGGHRLLFLGRIRQKKGAFDLLRAFAAVRQAVPGAMLVMAGDGEVGDGVRLSQELGIADAVEFTGWIEGEAKQRALDQAQVFVLPSYFEGLPIGVLEAMASGLLVVASPVGGIPDVIDDGVHGLLVAAGDVDALSLALVTALRDSDATNRMVAAAWQRVQQHEAGTVMQRVLAIYDEIAPVAREVA